MFLIQCTGRSGSTYLEQLLASHDDIKMWGEFIYPDPLAADWHFTHYWGKRIVEDLAALGEGKRSECLAEYLRSKLDEAEGKRVGFDLKLEYLDAIPWAAEVIYGFAERIIVLKRANLLKQVVSHAILTTRIRNGNGSAHSVSVPERTTIDLDPQQAVDRMRRLHDLTMQYELIASATDCAMFTVVYEDLLTQNAGRVLEDLQAFIGVEPRALSAKFVKQNPQPLSELIENYDELAQVVKESEFAYTLYLPS